MIRDSFEAMRHAMVVSQLRPDGVNDPRVIEAMSSVAREDYVPVDRRATAYIDRLIPLPDGRGINPPTVTGRLLNEAQLAPGDRVLIIGAASGYTAAVVGRLAHSVTSIGAGGLPSSTYDVVLIDGAVEELPEPVIDCLAPGGRLVTGLVEAGVTRLAIGRRGRSGFGIATFMDAEMVVLPEYTRPRTFVF